MALIGDVLIRSRELFPDRAASIPAPSGFTSSGFAGSITLAAGTYLVSVTFSNQWGETLPTALSTVAVNNTTGIQVSGTIPVGVTALNVYYGIGALNQVQSFISTPAQVSAAGTASVPPATAGGTPVNRAYLPDTDGSIISAATLYRWLNQALDAATDESGGIQDRTGVGSQVGVGVYTLPVVGWKKLTNVWYDGYDVFSGRKRDIFRRNAVAAYTNMSVSVTLTPSTVIEGYPQPQRTAGSTTLTANLNTSALSVAINPANFTLPLGLASISQGATFEIVWYSSLSNNTISGMTRGLGGTIPQSFTSGATVTELNFWCEGFRRAVPAVLGNATSLLQVPPSWPSLLPLFLEAKFRRFEQQFKEADQLEKEFRTNIKAEAASMKQLSGPVQIADRSQGWLNDLRGGGPFGVYVP